MRVRFVEMTDTIPVHGPESEVHDGLFTEDLLALLDVRERQIVVLIRSGMTKVGEISKFLGYANQSCVKVPGADSAKGSTVLGRVGPAYPRAGKLRPTVSCRTCLRSERVGHPVGAAGP
jgi:hypothetical protein